MKATSGWGLLLKTAGGAGFQAQARRSCQPWAKGHSYTTKGHSYTPKGHSYTWPSPLRRYATETTPARANKSRTGLYVLGGLVIVAAGAAAVSDEARYAYIAAQRTGRVVGALFFNINDYRRTLNQRDSLPDADYTALLKSCHKRCAERTLVVLEKNGSIFVKLGQHLSSMNYLLPAEWCDTFIPLQDQCPVSSMESVEEMVMKDTGRRLSDYFSHFETTPIGAASLAQVHRATLRETGELVAVKVQHPALDEWAALDLALTRFTFRMLKRFFPEYDLTWLSAEMDQSLPKELDFALEGTNAERARLYFARVRNTPLVIPKVHWAQRRIVVMEYITGHRLDDLEYLDVNGIDRDDVSAALARIFNEMIFGKDAPLHCDPHGGNIAIRLNTSRRAPHNFDVVLYDHGLYRLPDLHLRRSYAKLWLAVIDADEPRMRLHAKEVAGITDEQFPLFASAITGRDYRVVTSSVSAPRTSQEKDAISDALGDGMLEQLVQLLGQVPRVILLILKTNDLTRSLDENLHTRQGPLRSFMILARYAARAVYEEKIDALAGNPLWPANLWLRFAAWASFARFEAKLSVFEMWLSVKRRLGMDVNLI